jgi:hypothetical protein
MEETTQTQDNITVGDVVLMHNIIATVSRRGAFEADEFQIVGKLFEKLKGFLPKKEETAETANTSEEVPDNQLSFNFAQGQDAEGEA